MEGHCTCVFPVSATTVIQIDMDYPPNNVFHSFLRGKTGFHAPFGKRVGRGTGEQRHPELRKRTVDTRSRTGGGLHGAEVATLRTQTWEADVRSGTPTRKKNLKASCSINVNAK